MRTILLALTMLAGLGSAIHFDLVAYPENQNVKRCLSQWVPNNTPVQVKVGVETGLPGQSLNFEIHDDSSHANQYASRFNVKDETIQLTTQAHANVIVCFQNVLLPGTSQDNSRIAEVSLKMTSGHSMTDFHKLQVEYKLAPLEVELRRLASNLEDTQEQLTYLKMREAELRSLTELSNDRVKHLNIFAISILITAALGQILYLRRFFKAKKLI